MLEAFEVRKGPSSAAMQVVLTFEERQKSRHRTETRCGQSLGWFIERGQVLADGDLLCCADGSLVQIVAAQEQVSRAETSDSLLLARAAYHLGNRHVPLEIGAGYLAWQHDHVLDEMVTGLGLSVQCRANAFNPETGAYHTTQHAHHDAHHHDTDHHPDPDHHSGTGHHDHAEPRHQRHPS